MKYTLTLLAALLLPLWANAKSQAEKPGNAIHAVQGQIVQNQTPSLSAQAYLLYDYTSKQVLHQHNSRERIAPASLTKLMTAYLAFSALTQNRIALNQKVTPSVQALRNQPSDSKMYLDHRKAVTIEELLHGMITISASDAARVLAEFIAGSEPAMVEQMNREAQRLGMADTHFSNASGSPDPMHYSSAHDLALLAAAVVQDYPEYFPLYAQREFQYNHIKFYNRNRLLWNDPHVDGMQTGHAEGTGYSLIATSKRGNHRLIAVVIGTGSEHLRSAESQRLLNHGFQDYDIFYMYKRNETISSIRLWKGTEDTVKIGIREGLTLTLPKGQRHLLKATMETQQPLLAPIGDGQQVGILRLTLDDKPYLEYPLVALEPVQLVNIFSRGIDSIRMIFSK